MKRNVQKKKEPTDELLSHLYEYLILHHMNPDENILATKKHQILESTRTMSQKYISSFDNDRGLSETVPLFDKYISLFEYGEIGDLIKKIGDDSLNSSLDVVICSVIKEFFTSLRKEIDRYFNNQAYERDRTWKDFSLQYPKREEFILPSGRIVSAKDFGMEEVQFGNLRTRIKHFQQEQYDTLTSIKRKRDKRNKELEQKRREVKIKERKLRIFCVILGIIFLFTNTVLYKLTSDRGVYSEEQNLILALIILGFACGIGIIIKGLNYKRKDLDLLEMESENSRKLQEEDCEMRKIEKLIENNSDD